MRGSCHGRCSSSDRRFEWRADPLVIDALNARDVSALKEFWTHETVERYDVFVHWHLTGTHTGPLLGIAPTGKPIAIDGMDHFVIRVGKVVSNFVIVDQMQYARQIGMMPPDGSAADKALKAAFNARTKVASKLKR